MPGELDAIAKQELFARLAEGHAAAITVVTPNRRLAQVLKSEFDGFQIKKDLRVWEDADILPLSAFAERLYEDALYSADGAGLPRLLAPGQEREIWESILAGSGLLALSEAAAQAMDAWRLAHAWRIAGALGKFPGNEDARAFARWAREYARRCDREGLVDSSVLPDLVLKIEGRKPKLLVAYAFDVVPPQTAEMFDALSEKSIEIKACKAEKHQSNPTKTSFLSARHELEAAAQWARARLEAGARRIGVVVPDLTGRRREVVRVFSRVMAPGFNLPGAPRGTMPFNVSLGEALGGYPLVHSALRILEFSSGETAFEDLSRLIRSPFLAGAEAEFAARARLDARLRERLPARLTLPKLIGEIDGCPVLRSCLEKLFSVEKPASGTAHAWAQHFTALLDAAGFPGERALDSDEFQARARFNEALGDFARLALVAGKMSYRDALARLRRLCAETLFEPETPDVPVQVVGILESAGMEFDCLWVSGLTEDAWPLAARPNPFLPVALQKRAGIPQAGAEASLEFDRRITEGWQGAAAEVVFSWPRKEEDRDLAPSPLISRLPEREIGLPSYANYRDLLFASRDLENFVDEKAPPLALKTIKGGTRVLADQAACPFRAFARHRLGAEALESPAEGLDAMRRGQLLHALMAGVWNELKSKGELDGDLSKVISKAAENAVKELEIEERFAELEKKRLEKLALEWLEVERGRETFEVVSVEEKRELEIGDLTLSGRIDRMDRLKDGTHALIDYKTGAQLTPRMWMGERPDEPQLPLYAVNAGEEIGAVAFARLKAGRMRFMGFSREQGLLPGTKRAESWKNLFQAWKKELEKLARDFARGDARVDPKKALATCRNCGLQPLCRVHERLNALAAQGEEGE